MREEHPREDPELEDDETAEPKQKNSRDRVSTPRAARAFRPLENPLRAHEDLRRQPSMPRDQGGDDIDRHDDQRAAGQRPAELP